jgi:curved DNA-binding protein CbpA
MGATFFKNCECLEDVKHQYRKLVMQYHPDNNLGRDTLKAMQIINAEYEALFERFKNIHRNAEGDVYQSSSDNKETAAEFAEIINKLIHLPETVKVELIGSWIWVSGDTRPYKDYLKELRFKWCSNKKAWAWHKESYKKRSSKKSLDEIRSLYGSEEIKTKGANAIA